MLRSGKASGQEKLKGRTVKRRIPEFRHGIPKFSVIQ